MTNSNKLADALRGLLEHVDRETCRHESTHRGGSIWTICDLCDRKWADDRGGFIPYSEPASMAAARLALAEHDAPDKCFCDRMYPDSNPNASCGDCPTRDYAPQPAPAPVHEGLWRCSQCGEPADAMSSRWRWSGKEWQHHHGAQVGHVNSRYFGSDAAAPVQVDVLSELADEIEEAYPNADASNLRAFAAAHPPAHAADGAGELPPLPEPTCLGFRNPCGITQLPDMGIYGYTADQVRACQREAIAALRQPVPDAVREGVLIRQLRGRAAFLRNRGRVKSPALMEEAASRLESAIASQQESRNG